MKTIPLLSLLVFTPWIGAGLLAVLRRSSSTTNRIIALLFSLSTLALSLPLLSHFDPARIGPQFVEREPWIAALNIHYHLGLDGLSLMLVLLTGIVTPVALLASWRLERSARLFCALFLLLQGAALGVFLALDFFHWFLFWELSLVPAFFLIKLWGGAGATRAAYQFVIYTIGGSAFMLLGFAALYVATGTMDFLQLAQLAADGTLAQKLAAVGGGWPQAVFLGVFIGLAVKVPLWPFHTWLPPAYAEAPTGASMFLTGVMSKMGVYGFLRILWPLFPGPLHAAAPCLLWLALGGIVLGAFAAMRQTDLKRMIAYSSLNHLNYCLLALFAVAAATGGARPVNEAATAALSGTLLQVFNHGLSAAALFYCVGVLETRSGGRRGIGDFGGVRTAAPIFAGLCGVAMFSSLGLPGLNGFVGEFLIFRGVFGLTPWAAGVACLGLLATALFLLTFWQRVFHGPKQGAATGEFSDLRGIEYAPLIPLVALMFLLGVAPHLLTQLFNPLITAWAGHLVLP
ncbi:complex I subunit 4 family protein [Horticoccus sp. 23ND18S-11]|uniref:complex I subunit 4 family protein n=1 Tax=Horticoccus sp. 23ND18S-11 TaxID=3391832 RepID=UPI0039C9D8C6